MTVVVSIGRNVGDSDETLSDQDWHDFRFKSRTLVMNRGFDVVFVGDGFGDYATRQEQSYTVIGAGDGNAVGLYHSLAALAREYRQDSIALTTGQTAFPGSE